MSSRGISIFDGIVPIITLLVAYIMFTIIVKSSNKVQDVVCGTLSVIIKDGKLVEDELSKLQYTVSDIMEQLREKDVFKIQDVKCAMVETNGTLNVIKYTDNMNFIPLNVIEDGKISDGNIKILNMNENDVENIVKKENLKIEEILVGTLDENNNFLYQLKSEVNKNV